jgi:thiamine pyrophosphokinase
LVGSAGELLTLLAVGGHATGVRTTGLRFSLSGDTLVPGSTLGVSNELLGGPATVSVETGVVVAIRPYPGSP